MGLFDQEKKNQEYEDKIEDFINNLSEEQIRVLYGADLNFLNAVQAKITATNDSMVWSDTLRSTATLEERVLCLWKLTGGRKIRCIKILRSGMGLGLKEAKEIMELVLKANGIKTSW